MSQNIDNLCPNDLMDLLQELDALPLLAIEKRNSSTLFHTGSRGVWHFMWGLKEQQSLLKELLFHSSLFVLVSFLSL